VTETQIDVCEVGQTEHEQKRGEAWLHDGMRDSPARVVPAARVGRL
jgi:hypothetical protein